MHIITVDKFVELRTEELRQFFQGRFGRHWLKVLRSRLGGRHSLNFFRNRVRPSLKALIPVEALAISLGFMTTRLDLPPRERKLHEKMEAIKRALALQATLPGTVDDESLFAMARHKLRARPLRDDVFPIEFLEKWCEAEE